MEERVVGGADATSQFHGPRAAGTGTPADEPVGEPEQLTRLQRPSCQRSGPLPGAPFDVACVGCASSASPSTAPPS